MRKGPDDIRMPYVFAKIRHVTDMLEHGCCEISQNFDHKERYKLDHYRVGKLRSKLRTLVYYANVESVGEILALAAAANWYEIVQAILDKGVSPSYQGEAGNYAFDQCILHNSADAARTLMESGEFEGYDNYIMIWCCFAWCR